MAKLVSRIASEPTEEQFFQPIGPKNLRRIKFPRKFYKKYVEGKHRGEFVTLKSPLLSKPWKVKRIGEKLKDGWGGFVKLHDLKVGDYVHFSHEGSFVFYVTTFTENGNRILYGNHKLNQLSIKEVSTLGGKLKIEHDTREAGNLERARGGSGIVIKDAGDSSSPNKKMKKDTTSLSVDSDSFFQTVTYSNLRSNSVYIPMKFAKENHLQGKRMGFVGLVNSDENVWGAEVTCCTDGRFKIFAGWRTFCSDNNIREGDCCKFKLQPGHDHIMLDLVGVFKDGKKPADRLVGSSLKVKEEQDELEEDDGPGNEIDYVDLTLSGESRT